MNLPGGGLLGEPRARRLCAVVASAAVCLLVLAGCSASNGSESSYAYGPGQPQVGSCHALTLGRIYRGIDTAVDVPCSRPHTSLTIAVGGFPDSQVTPHNVSDGALANAALQHCNTAWRRVVGGDEAAQLTTVVSYAYFLPSSAQLSAGARWYRCDVVIGSRGNMSLQSLPSTVHGILSGTLPDSLRACRTSPGFDSGHEVACSSAHVLRAVGIAPLQSSGGGYPTAAALKSESAKGCAPVVHRWLHGQIGGGIAYQWPDKRSWTLLGDHYATCWTVTTN